MKDVSFNNYDLSSVFYEATKAWEEGFDSYEKIIKYLLDTINDLHTTKEELASSVKQQSYQLSSKDFEVNQYKAAAIKLQEKESNEQKLKHRLYILTNKHGHLLHKYDLLTNKPPNKDVSCQTYNINNYTCPTLNNGEDELLKVLNQFKIPKPIGFIGATSSDFTCLNQSSSSEDGDNDDFENVCI